jgi:hypothetical protein
LIAWSRMRGSRGRELFSYSAAHALSFLPLYSGSDCVVHRVDAAMASNTPSRRSRPSICLPRFTFGYWHNAGECKSRFVRMGMQNGNAQHAIFNAQYPKNVPAQIQAVSGGIRQYHLLIPSKGREPRSGTGPAIPRCLQQSDTQYAASGTTNS